MAEKTSGNLILFLLVLSLIGVGYYLYVRGPTAKGFIIVDKNAPAGVPSADRGVEYATGSVRGMMTTTEACAKRPRASYGACGYFLGVFSNGVTCIQTYGCSLLGDVPPFADVASCTAACVPARVVEEEKK
jgi:hypothetical protein